MRCQRAAFFSLLLAIGYHGYKLSYREFLRGRNNLVKIKDYIVEDPDN